MNHSLLCPVLNLDTAIGCLKRPNQSAETQAVRGGGGGGDTMDIEEDSSHMLVFSCESWGVQLSLGTSCWVAGS